MPEFNSIQHVSERDIDMKLIKGPDESLGDELLISDQNNEDTAATVNFDFALRAYISGNS